jgi:protoporphyrinogen/coproporphyrinogen III oxidase
MGMNQSVAIVGAGISGLALAYQLKQQGKQVTVLEAAPKAGGKISTIRRDGFELNLGPVSCSTNEALNKLIQELKLEDEVLPAEGAVSKRYIYSKGKIHAIQPSPLKLLTHPILSLKGKLGLLKDLWVKTSTEQQEDETVAQFVRRHFGEEAHQKLFNPVLNGIYAGNSEALSIQFTLTTVKKLAEQYGSVIKGLRAEKDKLKMSRKIISFRGGIHRLVTALQNVLEDSIQLSTEVTQINMANGKAQLTLRKASKEVSTATFDKVYVTLPAFACARILQDTYPDIATSLGQIRYNQVSQIYCEVDLPQETFDGFGFLVPAEERFSLLGAVCVSNIFKHKAPEGKRLFVLFCGGDRPYSFEPDVKEAIQEFTSILHPTSVKPLHIQEWTNAIPQFQVGHQSIIRKLKEFENHHNSIAFAGNYISGISVGDCISFSG